MNRPAPDNRLLNELLTQLELYGQLMRIDKPIGIWLLLWPTLWALWISADGSPDAWVFTAFVLGVLITRSAGCVINDYADLLFDMATIGEGGKVENPARFSKLMGELMANNSFSFITTGWSVFNSRTRFVSGDF